MVLGFGGHGENSSLHLFIRSDIEQEDRMLEDESGILSKPKAEVFLPKSKELDYAGFSLPG